MDNPSEPLQRSLASPYITGLASFLATCSIILLSYNLDPEGARLRSVVHAATDQNCS